MRKTYSLFFISALFAAVLAGMSASVSAQSAANAQADAHKAELEANLAELEKEIAEKNLLLQGKQKERVSLERDVAILETQITKAKLLIKTRDITISKLGGDITNKTIVIDDLSKKIGREQESLAQLLRKTNEVDQSSVVEMLLSKKNLSDFFLDIDSFTSIKGALRDSLLAIAEAKGQTEEEKAALEESRRKEADAKADLEAQKRAVQKNEGEKNKLLSITKNKEKEYKKVLDERKARAAEIRAALFALRDSGEIPFGRAYEYALVASQKTGVRPAFILAIFSQESSFGKNQGSCYLKDSSTGGGVGANTGRAFAKVMHPTRDVPPFLELTRALGRDPFATRVSCPQEVGWGGAMGPAQFIPSTWVGLQDTIAAALGVSQTDPWNPRDAFMAAALYLRDLGAAGGGYSNERDAACRYFSGSKCSKSSFVAGYGNSVIAKATNIQENMIDPLQNL
ncbi:MAG: lytic murein transglycosylase [Parcubacteria group bacterium]|nr:lytic murein transglycosylase [Parcubacteria group bacterium]